MTEELFDIVFRGDILPGFQLREVKQQLGQLFKVDQARINALFGVGVVSLSRNLDQTMASKYQAVLRKAGADVGSSLPTVFKPSRALNEAYV